MFTKFKCLVPVDDEEIAKQDFYIDFEKDIILTSAKIPSDIKGPTGEPMLVNGTKMIFKSFPIVIDEPLDDVMEKLK